MNVVEALLRGLGVADIELVTINCLICHEFTVVDPDGIKRRYGIERIKHVVHVSRIGMDVPPICVSKLFDLGDPDVFEQLGQFLNYRHIEE